MDIAAVQTTELFSTQFPCVHYIKDKVCVQFSGFIMELAKVREAMAGALAKKGLHLARGTCHSEGFTMEYKYYKEPESAKKDKVKVTIWTMPIHPTPVDTFMI